MQVGILRLRDIQVLDMIEQGMPGLEISLRARFGTYPVPLMQMLTPDKDSELPKCPRKLVAEATLPLGSFSCSQTLLLP